MRRTTSRYVCATSGPVRIWCSNSGREDDERSCAGRRAARPQDLRAGYRQGRTDRQIRRDHRQGRSSDQRRSACARSQRDRLTGESDHGKRVLGFSACRRDSIGIRNYVGHHFGDGQCQSAGQEDRWKREGNRPDRRPLRQKDGRDERRNAHESLHRHGDQLQHRCGDRPEPAPPVGRFARGADCGDRKRG